MRARLSLRLIDGKQGSPTRENRRTKAFLAHHQRADLEEGSFFFRRDGGGGRDADLPLLQDAESNGGGGRDADLPLLHIEGTTTKSSRWTNSVRPDMLTIRCVGRRGLGEDGPQRGGAGEGWRNWDCGVMRTGGQARPFGRELRADPD